MAALGLAWALAVAMLAGTAAPARTAERDWQALNAEGLRAYQAGDFAAASGLFRSALEAAGAAGARGAERGLLLGNLAVAALAGGEVALARRAANQWREIIEAGRGAAWAEEQAIALASLSATIAAREGGAKPDVPAADPDEGVSAEEETFAVHLASLRSEALARAEWRRLQGLYPEFLGPRTAILRPVLAQDGERFVRVLAGPFRFRASAESVCGYFTRVGQYCAVVDLEPGS